MLKCSGNVTLVASVPNIGNSLRHGAKASPDAILGAVNSELNLHLTWSDSEPCLEALDSRTDATNGVGDKERWSHQLAFAL